MSNATFDAGQPGERALIPAKVHFIFGLAADFGGKPFSFVHFLSIRSFLHHNPGFAAFLYFAHEPHGPYWDAARHLVTPVRVTADTEIFGRPLCHVAHQADVMRLQILIEHGGIYLDLDTLTARSFSPLLAHEVVLGTEIANGKTVGLCNAVIAARPQAAFLKTWLDNYRSFRSQGRDAYWNEHSVLLPAALSREMPASVTIVDHRAFFEPDYSGEGLAELFFGTREYPDAYCHHLWESLSWPILSRANEANLELFQHSQFGRLAKACLGADDLERIALGRKEALARLMQGPIRLNIGCGANMRADHINIDRQPEVGPDIVCDVARERWPFDDSSVDAVVFTHSLEHIGDGFEFLMCELYRVCRSHAKVYISAPHPLHDWFLGDPTHVRPLLPGTFELLDREKCIRQMMSGDRKTPLALYWKVDFVVLSIQYHLDSGYLQFEQQGRVVPRDVAIRHLGNAVAEMEVVLQVRKATTGRQDMFRSIYLSNAWGGEPGQLFSGLGSLPQYTSAYVGALLALLREGAVKTVVDLGCGDFQVGRRIAEQMPNLRYLALDIVPEVIEHSAARSSDLKNVEFQVCDMLTDDLPAAEVCLLRQVLQHYDNASVLQALRRLERYPLVVISEHIRLSEGLIPNLDQQSGHRIRCGGGLQIDKPPFSMACRVAFDIPFGEPDEVIRTYIIDNSVNRR